MIEAPNRRSEFGEDRKKIEGHVRKSLTEFRVTETAFTQAPSHSIHEAVTLLSYYELNPRFYEDPTKVIFAVAVADQLPTAPDTAETRSLHGVLKLLAADPTRNRQYTTESNLIQRLAAAGDPDAQLFHPHYHKKITWENLDTVSLEDLKTHRHDRLTTQARESTQRWGRKTQLDWVRNSLNITPKTEKPFFTLVLDKSEDEMHQELNTGAFYIPDSRTIILPRNYKDYIEHEYAHSQAEELTIGYKQKIFSGLSEAFTERITRHPAAYYEERFVLKILARSQPEFLSIVAQAYLGDPHAHKKMVSSIIAISGFDGLLAIARMLDLKNSSPDALQTIIHTSPQKAIDILENKHKVVYFM